jgi:hypothetical protein
VAEETENDVAADIKEIRRAIQILTVVVVLIAAGLALILLGDVTINVQAQ